MISLFMFAILFAGVQPGIKPEQGAITEKSKADKNTQSLRYSLPSSFMGAVSISIGGVYLLVSPPGESHLHSLPLLLNVGATESPAF